MLALVVIKFLVAKWLCFAPQDNNMVSSAKVRLLLYMQCDFGTIDGFCSEEFWSHVWMSRASFWAALVTDS